MRLLSFIFILLFSGLVGCFFGDVKIMRFSDSISKTAKPDFETQCPKVETVTNQEDQDIEKLLHDLIEPADSDLLDILGPVSDIGENVHVRQDQKEDNRNEFTVPGSILLLYGLNLFGYEAFPTEISNAATFGDMKKILKRSRGVSKQLFEMRCSNMIKTWIMPDDYIKDPNSPREYIKPDFLHSANLYQLAVSANDIYFHHSYQEIISSLKGQVEFETDLGFLGGSSTSASYKRKINTMKEGNLKVVEGHECKEMSQLNTQTFDVMREQHVTPEFVRFLNYLPDEYNKELYENFLNKFGTHYFEKAIIGSCHYKKSETSQTYLLHRTEDELTESANLRLFNQKSESTNINTESRAYTQYVEQSTFTESYITSGGMIGNDESEWIDTWPFHPWVIDGNLVPIYDLIEDDRKSDNMRLALIIKQLRVFMDTFGKEIEEMINYFGISRIEHESYREPDMVYYTNFPDGMSPSSVGNCDKNVDEDINEMVCCYQNYSVKVIVEAYKEIKSFYESPTVAEPKLALIRNKTKIAQAGLFNIKGQCFKSKRRDL